jgi:hypothetical protein
MCYKDQRDDEMSYQLSLIAAYLSPQSPQQANEWLQLAQVKYFRSKKQLFFNENQIRRNADIFYFNTKISRSISGVFESKR